MPDDPNRPMVLTTVPTEVQAELIVAALAGRGVKARTEGGLTGGFRAEAPGRVQVIVRQADLELAQDSLRVIEAKFADHDEEKTDDDTQ